MLLASIPSPQFTAFSIGPLTIHAYALCILLGIVIAIRIGQSRWFVRGGQANEVADIAIWAVPAGIMGGRLYHVITTPDRFFGTNGKPLEIFAIWKGGLGIWGAISLGALGAWVGHRRLVERNRQLGRTDTPSFAVFADAIAPGILVAQAVGRWGNWFNKELFGGPTNLPWGLEIPPTFRPIADQATYHPTFLYESLWCLLLAVVIVGLERRYRLATGQTFAVYVFGYCLGRFWWEWLRVDPANVILGMRVNSWVSIAVALFAIALFRIRGRVSSVE